MNSIGFLFDEILKLSAEEEAAARFLRSLKSFRIDLHSIQSLNQESAITKLPSLLWWHFDSSISLPSTALQPEAVSVIREYIRRGGSLFLSLLASQYVVNLGLEQKQPNIVSKGSWNEENWAPEFPDIRGFGTYLGHPIFQDLPGGVYTWNPSKGDPHCAAYYEGITPGGNVVAVDRQYIKLNEQRRLICEYQFGKGRIVTVGTYFFFENQRHRFRPHLERFASNCLKYLSSPSSFVHARKTYWYFGERTVKQVERKSSKALKFGTTTLPTLSGEPIIDRDPGSSDRTDQSFDVGGRRIMIAGKERGGISEVWCHPVRIVRNFKVAFKVGDETRRWSHELKPQFTARPQCIARTYTIDGARIDETVFGDLNRPSGVVNFRVDSEKPVEIIVTASVDLRMMWPLSDAATGPLTYAWDGFLQSYTIEAPYAHCSAIIGSASLPVEHLAGQYTDIDVSGTRFVGHPTNSATIAVAFRIRLSGTQPTTAIYIAGSSVSNAEAEKAYRIIAKDPSSALRGQARYYRSLFNRYMEIQSPDHTFNAGFRWAVTSTDRFFTETPGVGSSLFAGYGTTERGWNGGHVNSGRPGYAWYFGRDSVWTCFALLGYGDFAKVKDVLEFLGSHQDPAGKIPHEVTTSGFAHYDAADSTPLFIVLLGKYLGASGDVPFVRKNFDRLLKAIDYCYSTDTDGDGLIENTNIGHGWVEGGRLYPVHVEHYLASCWAKALEEASYVASACHKKSLADKWKQGFQQVLRVIEKQFWNGQTEFYNFAKRADGTFCEEKTLLPAVGISFGYGKRVHAEKCLESYASEGFSADWGTRIVGNDNPLYNPTGYHYGSVWPLFTGWTSLAEFKMGRPIQGYVHAMNNLLLYDRFAAGTIEEVLHGEMFQPAGVCSHQAWSESMALQPVFDGMLGIEPDATRGHLSLRPYFPPNWKSVKVQNIPLGKRRISVSLKRTGGITRYEIRGPKTQQATISFQPYFPLGTRIMEIRTNEKVTDTKRIFVREYADCPLVNFRLRTKTVIEFVHSDGIAVIPPISSPPPGQRSKGIRVINEGWERAKYVLTLEGKSGESYSIGIFDPDASLRAVHGGHIEGRKENTANIIVTFEPSREPGGYTRKTVTLQIKT